MTENENNNLLDECLKELHKIAWDNSDNPTIIKNDVFNVWNKLLEYKMNKENKS